MQYRWLGCFASILSSESKFTECPMDDTITIPELTCVALTGNMESQQLFMTPYFLQAVRGAIWSSFCCYFLVFPSLQVLKEMKETERRNRRAA